MSPISFPSRYDLAADIVWPSTPKHSKRCGGGRNYKIAASGRRSTPPGRCPSKASWKCHLRGRIKQFPRLHSSGCTRLRCRNGALSVRSDGLQGRPSQLRSRTRREPTAVMSLGRTTHLWTSSGSWPRTRERGRRLNIEPSNSLRNGTGERPFHRNRRRPRTDIGGEHESVGSTGMSRFRSLLRLDSLRHVKAPASPGVPGPAAQHGSHRAFRDAPQGRSGSGGSLGCLIRL